MVYGLCLNMGNSTSHWHLRFFVSFISCSMSLSWPINSIRKEQYAIGDIFLLLSNAFIFYGLGYALLNDYATLQYWAGLFTIANALIHLLVSIIIKRLQLADKSLYYLVLGTGGRFPHHCHPGAIGWQLGYPLVGRGSSIVVCDWPHT